MQIDCAALPISPPFLIRELLMAVWRDQHWPLQDMSHRKWHELSSLVQDADSAPQCLTLPGAIRARGPKAFWRWRWGGNRLEAGVGRPKRGRDQRDRRDRRDGESKWISDFRFI